MLKSEPVLFDVPHEPGETMSFNRLSWKEMKEARKVAAEENREEVKAFGAEFIAALQSGKGGADEAKKLLKAQEYAASNYDTAILLKHGIASWSYGADVSAETIGQLDEVTAMWAKECILGLARPKNEEETKNS